MPYTPDAAAAILHTERARAAKTRADLYRSLSRYEFNLPDGDDLQGDVRREVARLLEGVANRLESYSDELRERADDARSLRRSRYDDPRVLDAPDGTVVEEAASVREFVHGADYGLLDRLDGLGR